MAELGVFGVGVATADSELKTVGEKKTSVCTVNLAFNRGYKDPNDEWQNEPCFVRAQVWGARADRMAGLVKKGQPMYIAGYLKQDSWVKDGQKKVSYTISLRDFQICERNSKKNKDAQSTKPAAASVSVENSPSSDDIPF